MDDAGESRDQRSIFTLMATMDNQKLKLQFLVITLILFGVLTGCQLGRTTYAAQLIPTYTPQTILLTPNPEATQRAYAPPLTQTPTSSSPLFPTATLTSNQMVNANKPQNNTGAGSTLTNVQVPLIKQPENQVNILLLGSDQRPYEGGFRTDVILLVTINLDLQTVNMTSFPRDLYVTLPGFYNDRINTALFRGGFKLLADTFEYNFGVRPDYYGMVNFYGFQNLIDSLNGIDVEVSQTLTDHRSGYGDYSVYPGTVHMDGETALWYVRSRYSTSDFDRTRRQQEVVYGLVKRLISFDLVTKFPELYEKFQSTIETNLTLSEIKPLLPVADNLFRNEVGRYAVGPSYVSNWVTPGGAQVLLPNSAAIQALLKDALNAE